MQQSSNSKVPPVTCSCPSMYRDRVGWLSGPPALMPRAAEGRQVYWNRALVQWVANWPSFMRRARHATPPQRAPPIRPLQPAARTCAVRKCHVVPAAGDQRALQRQHCLGMLGAPAVCHQLQALSRASGATCRTNASRRRPANRQRNTMQQVALLLVMQHEGMGAAGLLLVQQRKHRLV